MPRHSSILWLVYTAFNRHTQTITLGLSRLLGNIRIGYFYENSETSQFSRGSFLLLGSSFTKQRKKQQQMFPILLLAPTVWIRLSKEDINQAQIYSLKPCSFQFLGYHCRIVHWYRGNKYLLTKYRLRHEVLGIKG